MRPRPRLLVLCAAILLVVLVLISVAAIAFAVVPVVLVLGLVVLTLLLGTRSRVANGIERAGDVDVDVDVDVDDVDAILAAPTDSGAVTWTVRWDNRPPMGAVPAVRERLAVVLAEWGLEREPAEPTLLVVTELLSNAVQHARAPYRLTVGFPGATVRVEVQDATEQPPRLLPHDPLAERGRGLSVVQALSTRWGWTNQAGGKIVWADVSLGWP